MLFLNILNWDQNKGSCVFYTGDVSQLQIRILHWQLHAGSWEDVDVVCGHGEVACPSSLLGCFRPGRLGGHVSLIGGPRGITDRDLRSGTGPGVGRTSFRFNYALVRAAWWQTGGFPRVPQLGGFS